MDTQKTESIVTLLCHQNGTGSQVNTSSSEVFKEFTDALVTTRSISKPQKRG